ncbi:MAG: response regulator transcription factor [Clostridia bacterium]|nr:response regulator transcription factor [Clostridia bacterium]
MATILIVDDEEKIRKVLREYLEFNKYTCYEAEDGMQAVKACAERQFDLIIMDIMMPRLDGISAVKEIKRDYEVPVLFLSARSEEYDKLFGFEVGGDDYVVKPFSPSEIVARVKVILNRSNVFRAKRARTYGDLYIDYDGRAVTLRDKRLVLTPKELELIFYLSKNEGIAVSREKLLKNVWGRTFDGDERTVDTHVKMLRGSLEDYRDIVTTVRNVGYKFEYLPNKYPRQLSHIDDDEKEKE